MAGEPPAPHLVILRQAQDDTVMRYNYLSFVFDSHPAIVFGDYQRVR